jgi:hypothetical protein
VNDDAYQNLQLFNNELSVVFMDAAKLRVPYSSCAGCSLPSRYSARLKNDNGILAVDENHRLNDGSPLTLPHPRMSDSEGRAAGGPSTGSMSAA